MKKGLLFVLVLAMLALVSTAAFAADVKIALVTDTGGINDQSFNASAWEGMVKAQEELGVEIKYFESKTDADYEPNLTMAVDDGYDLIIAVGWMMADQLAEVAEAYPDQKYLIFDDDTYAGVDSNVVNIVYKQNDLGYLVGTFAASMTQDTNVDRINEDKVIGFVGGYDSPVINDFMDGYISGAQAVDADMKIDVRYTSDYVDTAKAQEYGISMLNDSKCDIIWGVAGNAGNGAAQAILDAGEEPICSRHL